ncbi:hypothetical protein C3B58_12065, partial [Lactonifactor longoviformis]
GKRKIAALLLTIVFCLSGNSAVLAAQLPAQTETKAQTKEKSDIVPENNTDILSNDKDVPNANSNTDTQAPEKVNKTEDAGDTQTAPKDNITDNGSGKPEENAQGKQPVTGDDKKAEKSTDNAEDKKSESKAPEIAPAASDQKADDKKDRTSEPKLESQVSAASPLLQDRAAVPSSQTRILTNFSLGDDSMSWPGSGTEQDPKVQSGRASKDTFIVQAIDSEASINGGGERFEQALNYGANTINLKVVARDQVSVTYYRLTIERTKSPQNNAPSVNQFYPIAASTDTAADGGITGFEPGLTYDYKKAGASTWTPVPENAAEVTGLSSGVYEIRYGETDSMLAGLNSVKVTVPAGTPHAIAMGTWLGNYLTNTVGATNISYPSTATEGSLVTLSATLPTNALFITAITCQQTGGYSSTDESVRCLITPDGNGKYKYSLSFKMRGYDITLYDIKYKTGIWYTAELDDTMKSTVNITNTPAAPNDSFGSNGVTYYKDGSTVTSKITLVESGKYTVNKATATDKTTGQEVASSTGDTLTFEITGNIIITAELSLVTADFTELDKLLSQIPTNDLMVLDDPSILKIAPLLAQLPEIRTLSGSDLDKKILNGYDTAMGVHIDGYIDKLRKAVTSMKYRDADLSGLDEQMERIPELLEIYTPDSLEALYDAAEAAQKPSDENWDIRRQDEVDALTETLKNAIDGLKKIPAATPAVPELLAKTDTSISVKAVAGQEYSIDNGNSWISDGVFTNLNPAAEYQIITRVPETSTRSMSAASEPLKVTTDKSAMAAPGKPALKKVTSDTITVEAVKGQEYSIDGGKKWQDSGEFSGLKPAGEYEIITRIKETDTHYASKNSEALKVTTKEKTESQKTDEKKTDTKKDNATAAKTGDTSNMGLWILLLAFSAGMIISFAGINSQKKNKE